MPSRIAGNKGGNWGDLKAAPIVMLIANVRMRKFVIVEHASLVLISVENMEKIVVISIHAIAANAAAERSA